MLVKLFIGIIFNSLNSLNEVEKILQKKYRNIEKESKIFPFDKTDYYNQEFGENLKKKFLVFERLVYPQTLIKVKLFTNKIEKKLSIEEKRTVNLDPGYISLSKVVLASRKDYTHRILVDNGVYEEVCLYFKNKSFQSWPWTYPDYKTQDYISFFNEVRQDLYSFYKQKK